MSRNYTRTFKMLATFVLTIAMVLATVTPAFAAKAKKAPALNSTEQTICIGKTFDFNLLNEAKNVTVKWSSSNTKVATVDAASGLVLGVARGNTNIHCVVTTADKTTYRLMAKVTVIKPAVKVEITNKITNLKVGKTYNLDAIMIPKSANDSVTWSTSDKTIANPASNGVFKALKAGKVTITATTISGRKDSVTIQILAVGEEYVEPTPNVTPTPVPKEEDTTVPGTVFSENFAKGVGIFTGRGNAMIQQVNEPGAEGKKGYLSVTGRTANWNGASADVTGFVTKGKTYDVTGWVKYTEGNDTETFKITQQKNGSSWPQITGDVVVNKGEWTKLSGKLVVDADTTQCEVYFEMSNNANANFLCDDLLIVDPTGETVKAPEEKPAKTLPAGVVYQNDFEDGSILDARVGSERTNTTAVAHGGKACVEVKRTAAWDGAGIKFTPANGIVKEDLFGKTVHVKMYVMYNEGADSVEFKLNNKMSTAEDSDNIISQIPVKKGEWTLIEGDAVIAKGAAGNLIFLETVDASVTFFVDDAEITLVK